MARPRRPLLAAIAAACVATASAQATEVTIYRCTNAQGQLTLRDTPCLAGEKQEARAMVRPKDPPLRPAAPAREAPTTAYVREPAPRYVMVTPPQPLYECMTPDGERYTSDSGEGRGHWEPLWTMGYPVYPYPRPYAGGYSGRVNYTGGKVSGSVRIGNPYPNPNPPPMAVVPAYPTGQWVYDECHQLPQDEVCDRLRDQRYELNRRWNIAQPSERVQLDRETRGIDARLSSDCGGA
ncbi:MAG TPA: DUF4124 domain-containing protein [Lysobacter sp.]|jgi:hypothetical protein|nr:DUF4124 domain-containing protein [Lysobacter sp.]